MLAASWAYVVRIASSARASAVWSAGLEVGNGAGESKPVCKFSVSKREERKAKEKRSVAREMPRPARLRGKDASRD